MTAEEAIIQLNFDMEMIRFEPSTGENLTLEEIKAQNEENYKTYLADELAISALVKEIPQKIVNVCVIKKTIGGYCPNCNGTVKFEDTFLTRAKGQRCSWCGQKLDW